MLLQEWGYTQEELQRALFKYGKGHSKAGQTISLEHYKMLSKYINFIKKAQRIRNGVDFEFGRYGMTKTIAESKLYYEYISSPNEYIKNSKEIGLDYLNINFKSNELTPLEEIAILPYEQYINWMKKFNIIGTDGSPIKLNYNVHRNAHDAAINHINLSDIGSSFIKDAIKDYNEMQKTPALIKKEWEIGEEYSQKMVNRFHKLMRKLKPSVTSSPSFMERNDSVNQWKMEFDAIYKNLSEVSKIGATYYFLNGVQNFDIEMNKAFGVKAPKWIPPASKNKMEFQLLNEKVLSKFIEVYNNKVANDRNLESRFDSISDLMLEESIEKACK